MGIQHLLKTVEYNKEVCVVSDELLHKIQGDLLEMMKDFAAVFKKHDIKWTLSGGSILGAMRHRGFIPWDDDIDIFMQRAEFEKFRKVFDEELSDKYELFLPGDENYIYNMPQIHKKGTKLVSIQSPEVTKGGLFVDIFILENTYNNAFRRKIHGLKSTMLLFIDSSLRMKRCKANILKYTDNDPQIKKEVNKRANFSFLFSFNSLEKWLKITDKYFSKVKEPTDYLVCPSGAKHFFGEIYDRKMFDGYREEPFETEMFCVPIKAEDYINQRYGSDYMQLPKTSERERHIYAQIDLGGEA